MNRREGVPIPVKGTRIGISGKLDAIDTKHDTKVGFILYPH